MKIKLFRLREERREDKRCGKVRERHYYLYLPAFIPENSTFWNKITIFHSCKRRFSTAKDVSNKKVRIGMNFEVKLNCGMNTTLVVDIIEAYMSHIMHMRGQIPLPIPLLSQYLSSQQCAPGNAASSLKIKRTEKKVLDFLTSFYEIIGDLRKNSQHHKILEAGILLGPSPSNPREAYFLHFKYDQSDEEISDTTKNAVCRKCVRIFLEYWSQDLPNPPPAINTYLCIRIESISSNLIPSDSQFILRDDFSPQFRRKGHQPVHVTIESNTISASNDNEELSMNVEDDDLDKKHQTADMGSWIVLSRGLKGIRGLKIDS